MVIIVNRVGIRVRITAPSLEVFPADKAAIDIDVRQRYRTKFLKVKVEGDTMYLERFEISQVHGGSDSYRV
jgi:hypothetical protein